MRVAGIREARQNLSKVLEEVRKGREVVLTDRGRPVARIVPMVSRAERAFTGRRALRTAVQLRGRPLSLSVEEAREDRT